MKLCINCKHYVLKRNIDNPELGRCGKNAGVSLVTGLISQDNLIFCSIERLPHKSCGVEAKLFEEKEASNV